MNRVFLDVDGPILDVSARYYAVHQAIAGDSISRDFFWEQKRAGMGGREIVEHNGLAVSPDEYSRRWVAEIEAPQHMHLDVLQPGVLDAMHALRDFAEVAFVSLRQDGEQLREQLIGLNVATRDDIVLTASPLEGHGPELKIDRIQRRYRSLDPDDAIVGDTRIDLEAGKALGIRTIGVTCGIRTRTDLEKAHPTIIVANLPAAVSWLRR